MVGGALRGVSDAVNCRPGTQAVDERKDEVHIPLVVGRRSPRPAEPLASCLSVVVPGKFLTQ